MKYEKPIMEIICLICDVIVTSGGLSDKGDNDEGTGGGMDLTSETIRF